MTTKLDAASTQRDRVNYWLNEIAAARKREQEWRKDGKRVLDIYHGKKKDQIPFNIVYSNTETYLPALYNVTPRPVVQRRFKDEDPLGKVSATAGQRVLEFHVDTNSEEYQTYDDTVGDAVLDALLPGRGASWVKYDAGIVGKEPNRYVKWELVCFESLKWDRWVHGYAKKWKRVPWIAKEHDVSPEEAIELFGKEKAAKLTFTERGRAESREDDDRSDEEKTNEDQKIAKVWEIWIKEGRQIIFVSPNYAEDYLKEEDDPLGLTGFYPMPEPLRFLRKSNNLESTPPYTLYENQAKELNRITVRINRIVEALKVRGVHDSQIGEIERVLKLDDNQMVAAENVAALQTTKGLEGAIWLMPIEKLVVVLQQLYIAREQTKQVIYEITGIADIMRGQSKASETLGAQEIKNQWGTLRIKRMQKEVARYARDLLRICLEIAAHKFQKEQTWAQMTGLPFATTQEVEAAQGQVAAAKSQIAMMTGQQATPELLQQAVPQAMQTLQKPAWKQVLQLLKSDTQRMYRIDIETNSTIDVEATEDQKLMGEVLQAVSSFLTGVAPLVISGSMPFQVAQSMLLAIVRRYRFGSEIEDYIKQMQPPKSPDESKAKMEQEKHQMEMQAMQAEQQNKKEIAAMELEVKREELKLKKIELQMKHQAAVQKMELERVQGEQQLELSRRQGVQDLQIDAERNRMGLQQSAQEGEQKLQQSKQQGDEKLRQQKEAQKNKPKGDGNARS